MFRVLPFGLSTACYVFTKLLRPLVKRWRSLGLRAIIYIDDGFCASANVADCLSHKDIIISDLSDAGFVVNVSKSMLIPSQVGSWLGFVIDLGKGWFTVPPHILQKLLDSVAKVAPYGRVSVRAVASIVGQIISMSLAMGPITRLRSRALYTFINQRWPWFDSIPLYLRMPEMSWSFGKAVLRILMAILSGSVPGALELRTLMLVAQVMVGMPWSLAMKYPLGCGHRRKPYSALPGEN